MEVVVKNLVVGMLAVGGLFACVPGVSAQAVNGSNYRSLAVCDEVLIGGKWYSTFGEGRCPAGSRRPTRRISDPNQQAIQSMNGQVAALQGAQQSLVAAGAAMNARMMANADAVIETYEFSVLSPDGSEPTYVEKTRLFPEVGAVSMARVGDAILTRASGFDGDCIITNFSITHTDFTSEHVVIEGAVACKLKERDRAFTPLYVNYTNRIDRNNSMMMPWDVVRRRDGSVSLCLRSMGLNAACTPARDAASVSAVHAFITERGAKVPAVTLEAIEGAHLSFTTAANRNAVIAVDGDANSRFIVDGHEFEVLGRSEDTLVYRRIS